MYRGDFVNYTAIQPDRYLIILKPYTNWQKSRDDRNHLYLPKNTLVISRREYHLDHFFGDTKSKMKAINIEDIKLLSSALANFDIQNDCKDFITDFMTWWLIHGNSQKLST